MALNINPPNFGALTALAGNRIGNLSLPIPGSLGVKQAALMMQGMNSMLARRQMDQQDAARADRMDLANRQMSMMDIANREMSLREKAKAEKSRLEQEKLSMAKLMDEDHKDIQAKGAFATTSRIAMEQAKTPEEAASTKQEIIQEAVANKYLSDDEAKAASQMPISRFKNMLDYKIIQLGKVNDLKSIMSSYKQERQQGKVTVRPDGTVEVNSEPTSSVKTQLQKDVIDRSQALKELAPIREDFRKNYFTFKGQAGLEASKLAEKAEGIPGLEQVANYAARSITGKGSDARQQYIHDATSYLNAVERFFQQRYRKPITGAAAAVAELKDLRKSFLSGDMSPSEFQGALDSILQSYAGEKEFKQNVLREGVPVSDADLSATRNAYRQKGWTDSQIDAALKAKGYR